MPLTYECRLPPLGASTCRMRMTFVDDRLLPVRLLQGFMRDEAGTSTVEYALLAALLAFTLIISWPMIGPALEEVFRALTTAVPEGASEGSSRGGLNP